jgi:hypothetical protein
VSKGKVMEGRGLKGRASRAIRKTRYLVLDRCVSRDLGMQLLPGVRPKSSPDRQADLAAAKALVAQIEAARALDGCLRGWHLPRHGSTQSSNLLHRRDDPASIEDRRISFTRPV